MKFSNDGKFARGFFRTQQPESTNELWYITTPEPVWGLAPSNLPLIYFTYLQTDGRRSSCVAHKTATSNDDLSDSEVTTTPAPGGPNDPAVRGHLKIVVSKRDRRCDDDEDDEEGEGSVVSDEWKLIASIMDRLLFVLFLCISSVSSFTILVVRPLMKPSIHLE